ncbi:MAG: hypothetical protein WAR78_10615, partial [Ferruginibacter sp.]
SLESLGGLESLEGLDSLGWPDRFWFGVSLTLYILNYFCSLFLVPCSLFLVPCSLVLGPWSLVYSSK